MRRATLEAHGATFTEECVKAGPGGRFGGPILLEFATFSRRSLSCLGEDLVPGPSADRGAFEFGLDRSRTLRISLYIREWRARCDVDVFHFSWKRRAVIAAPARGTVGGVRGWVVKIPLQAPRVYKHRGAAKQARAYWLATVNGDGRLDRHEWRMCIEQAVARLIRAAVGEGVVDEAR